MLLIIVVPSAVEWLLPFLPILIYFFVPNCIELEYELTPCRELAAFISIATADAADDMFIYFKLYF